MRVAIATAVALSIVSSAVADQARASIREHTEISPQDLSSALKSFARDRGLAMIYRAELVSQFNTTGASGELTTDEALYELLSGTELTYKFLDDKTVTIVPATSAPTVSGKAEENGAQSATGLREGFRVAEATALEPGHKDEIAQSKDAYYLALRRTQGKIRTDQPDWQPWTIYFLTALKQQKDRLEKKIEREQILLGDLPELSIQILELCRERGRVTIGDVVKVTGISRNTIKDHVAALTNKGHLVRHGAGRGTWYAVT